MVSLSSCGFLGIGPWHGDALDETRESFETWDGQGLSIEELVISSQSGRPGERQNDAIVIGEVVDVEPGQSFRWTLTDDGEDRTILPFGDPAAESTSFHLSVEVSEVVVAGLGTDIEPGRIRIEVTHSADKLESVEDDYQSIGEVVFFLSQGSPVYDYAQDVWSIDYNQALIGRLGNNGEIDFPVVDYYSRPDSLTLDDLKGWATTI